MIIAFPPCTDLAVSGARHFIEKRNDGRQRKSIIFFCNILYADCKCIVVENPINIISGNYIKKYYPDLCTIFKLPIKPTQIIQPWQFGDNYEKTTCLWVKGVEPLKPIFKTKPLLEYHYYIDKYGKEKRYNKFVYDGYSKYKGKERSKYRSKTFPGIANAMANQWG